MCETHRASSIRPLGGACHAPYRALPYCGGVSNLQLRATKCHKFWILAAMALRAKSLCRLRFVRRRGRPATATCGTGQMSRSGERVAPEYASSSASFMPLASMQDLPLRRDAPGTRAHDQRAAACSRAPLVSRNDTKVQPATQSSAPQNKMFQPKRKLHRANCRPEQEAIECPASNGSAGPVPCPLTKHC